MPIIHFEDLRVGTQIEYPHDSYVYDCDITYTHITKLTFTLLKRTIPSHPHMTWNEVLYIFDIDHDREFATGLYQHDDNYYVVYIAN